MANKSISQLNAGTAVASTDIFPDVQTAGVGPVKVTALQLGTYVLTGVFDAGFTFNTTTKSLSLGVQQTTQAALVLANTASGAYQTTLKSSNSATAAWTLTLPITAGTAGYLFATDGSGNSSWTNALPATATGVSLTLGAQQSAQGSLVLANTAAGAFSVTLQSSNSTSAAWTMTLPVTAGTNGYILTTNGSGVTAWTNPTALGIDLDVGTTAITAGTVGRLLYEGAGNVLQESANLTFSTAALTLGLQQSAQGSVVLANTAAGAYPVTLQSSNSTSVAWTLTLPVTAGTNGYLLTTNGSGVTSWTNPTALGIDLDIGSTAITNGTTTRVLYDNAGVLSEASTLTVDTTSGKVSVVGASFGLSGNITAAAWTTNGIRYQNATATLTDTTSSGTVAAAYSSLWGGNTIAATNVTTFTNYYSVYFGAPVAGSNVTLTNAWSIGTGGNVSVGGNLYTATNSLVGGTAVRGTTAGTSHIDIFNGTAPAGTLTNGISLYSSSGDFYFMDAAGNGYAVGYRNIPQNSQTSAYVAVAGDVGKYVSITTGGVTVNASVFAVGDVFSIFNNSASTQSVTQGTNVTLRLAGSSTTGTRTLAAYGVATVLCIVGGATPTFVVSGNVT